MATLLFQGYIPSQDDPRDHEVSIDDLKELSNGPYPQAFNIYTDKSSSAEKLPFTPHIYDQGQIASCVCNAFASAYACALQRQGHDPSFKPSRLFLYYLARFADTEDNRNLKGKSEWFANMASNPPPPDKKMLTDPGSMDRDVLKAISSLGSCAEAESLLVMKHESQGTWPYVDVDPSQDVQGDGGMPHWMESLNATWKDGDGKFPDGSLLTFVPDPKCFANATRHRTLRYAHPNPVDSVECWKALIQAGYPVVFAINLYSSFHDSAGNAADGFIAKMPNSGPGDRSITGHVVMAVGWDDSKGNGGAFRVQNSWGDKWADGGFYWMEYSWLSNNDAVQSDAWVLIDSEDQ